MLVELIIVKPFLAQKSFWVSGQILKLKEVKDGGNICVMIFAHQQILHGIWCAVMSQSLISCSQPPEKKENRIHQQLSLKYFSCQLIGRIPARNVNLQLDSCACPSVIPRGLSHLPCLSFITVCGLTNVVRQGEVL